MDILIRIKRLVIAEKYVLTQKAADEMALDCLTKQEVVEAIVYATRITKIIRSQSPFRANSREKLYIICGKSLSNTVIYTKGVIRHHADGDLLYVLVSSKCAL